MGTDTLTRSGSDLSATVKTGFIWQIRPTRGNAAHPHLLGIFLERGKLSFAEQKKGWGLPLRQEHYIRAHVEQGGATAGQNEQGRKSPALFVLKAASAV